MNEYKLLLKDERGMPHAWVRKTSPDEDEHYISIDIFTQSGWSAVDECTLNEEHLTKYADVTCKWDGCCHWNFDDSYQHLCGIELWKLHAAIAIATFNFAKRSMEIVYEEYWDEKIDLPSSLGFHEEKV